MNTLQVEPSLEPPHDCRIDGHIWKILGEADGDTFLKCKVCGKETIQ